MKLRELIQRAIDIATKDLDSPVLRTSLEAAAEPMLPVVFGRLSDELERDPYTRHLLRRTKDLAVADGRVDLTDDVLTAYLCESTLFDPEDFTKLYSLTDWNTLVRGVLDERLGHFAVEGGSTLVVVEPGSTFAYTTGDTIALKLSIPCALVVPAIDAEIDIPAEALDMLLERLAQALRPVGK